jgi:exodeoxyribonuclease VII small subunit
MAKRVRQQSPPATGADSEGSAGAEASGDASFESSLEELESLVDRLEAGDLPLEAALAAFERGVSLTRRCAEQLASAERRIETLVQEGENWVTRPFAEAGGED